MLKEQSTQIWLAVMYFQTYFAVWFSQIVGSCFQCKWIAISKIFEVTLYPWMTKTEDIIHGNLSQNLQILHLGFMKMLPKMNLLIHHIFIFIFKPPMRFVSLTEGNFQVIKTTYFLHNYSTIILENMAYTTEVLWSGFTGLCPSHHSHSMY